ncbi:hypothetical protein PsorP6_004875 [Peronosclerospora sorghi]|uniref:Uncharacterized protein n=1 Tax=Peronosclerospora sorghi TaxID=230839 RepID=A0ACC0W422_9STRA|nr:hypothetical protein PsorP6_004875 [Peronosclerospora sorghi]
MIGQIVAHKKQTKSMLWVMRTWLCLLKTLAADGMPPLLSFATTMYVPRLVRIAASLGRTDHERLLQTEVVICKRYSEFYRLRKRVLDRLAAHKKQRRCSVCVVREQLKDVGFLRRIVMFKDPSTLVGKRTAGLEEFIIALCQSLSADHDVDICSEIASTRFFVKDFLQFPLNHERQHVRCIRQLQYVDPRDVVVDADACPICLCEWAELDGKQLVLSPCGHFFHEHCINEWYSTRFDCPICRTISGEGSDYSKSNY